MLVALAGTFPKSRQKPNGRDKLKRKLYMRKYMREYMRKHYKSRSS